MIQFKIYFHEGKATYNEVGIEKTLLTYRCGEPVNTEEFIVRFYNNSKQLAFSVIINVFETKEEIKVKLIDAFIQWYGSLWNSNIHSVEVV